MDELLEKRIVRALEGMPDDQARKVLDYIEFLRSKYGIRGSQPSVLERIADGVEDTLRVGKAPFVAMKGTRDVLATADKFVKGVTDAGRAVVDEIQAQLRKPAPGEKVTGEKNATQTPEEPQAETKPESESKDESGNSNNA